MKLALVTQDFPPAVGDIETYSLELAKRFATSADSLIVLAPGGHKTRAIDSDLGFRIERCGTSSHALPATLAPRLATLVARGEVDVAFHSQWQTLPASVALRRSGRLRGLFAAAHGRELLLQPLGKLPFLQSGYDVIRRGLLRSVDRLFPVSTFAAHLLTQAGVPTERCVVVANGTDPEHFRPMPAEALRLRLGLSRRPILLFAGPLFPNKGVDTIIRALPQLAAHHPDVVFVIVGDGPDQPRLRTLALEFAVEDRCQFVGRIPLADLPLFYSMADIFVTLSREEPPAVESFGIAFLEAGACGTAVIGSRSGGIPDAVHEGVTGLLVPPNDPDTFAQTAAGLLADHALRERMGKSGRARVVASGHWDATHDKLLLSMHASLHPYAPVIHDLP